ncbi:KptA family-domain-containing protein [Lentinula lateritia]|uniref:2'-phosphotransferase n=1 Tax=Lentinula lateritia TaxID=40482 RepID=A0ABQ8VDV2_9AGAR|nr:KptA family-domain-containing protein [Lentinula lateritia]
MTLNFFRSRPLGPRSVFFSLVSQSCRVYGSGTIISGSVCRPKIRKYAVETGRRLKISKSLSWLLRHQGLFEGIPIRSDGYARVQDVLKHESLSNVEFMEIENVVKKDSKGRFTLTYESERTEGDHWWIRANQGHSIETADLELERISSAERIPIALHGTTEEAWKTISEQGISRMSRNHIHLAQGFAGSDHKVFSGIRKSSGILIYIDVKKALADGLKFYLSANGVVLCPGNEFGFLEPKYFERVEKVAKTLKPIEGWKEQIEMQVKAQTSSMESTEERLKSWAQR